MDLFQDNSSETKNLKSMLHTYGFKQHLKKPTRICPTTFKKSLLDHFWTLNEQVIVKNADTFVGISDHFGTYLQLNLKKPKILRKKLNSDPLKSTKVTCSMLT